jgi:short-subunit dehydrogenase
MAIQRKALNEQTIVLTGATSGIGLATARLAAEQGAKLVLAARDADALEALAVELRARGTEVETVATDAGIPAEVAQLAQAAQQRFGQVDTWVNNAGISVYGTSEQVALDDMQRVMQTNFWGVVNGTLEAVKLMKAHGGGVIVNVGSEASERAIPLQGTYAASKHAVKAFTESLRMELGRDKSPIDLTLIKPASIDTPFTAHAKDDMDEEPALPPPVYAPELVAQAILQAAVHPQREIFVGGRAKLMSVASYMMPRSLDKVMQATLFRRQKSGQPTAPGRHDALHAHDHAHALEARGHQPAPVNEHNLYTAVSKVPGSKVLLIGGALLAAWAVTRRPARRAWHA